MKRLLVTLSLIGCGVLAASTSQAQVFVSGRIGIRIPVPAPVCEPQVVYTEPVYQQPYYQERVVVEAPNPGYGYYHGRNWRRERFEDRCRDNYYRDRDFRDYRRDERWEHRDHDRHDRW